MPEAHPEGVPSVNERIARLYETKNRHTDIKIKRDGFFDTDDHGYIPWAEPVPFKAIPNHPNGGVYGIRAVGQNFRRWLEVHPLYIHPMSSLAGAWISKHIPGMGGWRPEDRPTHLYPIFEKYDVYLHGCGGINHFSPDITIGLDLGWGGLLEKVRRYRELNRPTDTSFYDGEEDLILGVQAWIRRHVDHARALAASESDPWVRQNMLEIAEINEYLVDGVPRTFREACQFLAWFQSVDRMWGLGAALGQIDTFLRTYYEADIAAGRETDETIIWHLASLFFNDPHYSQIGGQAPDGHDLTNPLSFLVLEAMHRLHIPANIALRVWEGMDRRLLRKAIEYIIEDGTGVSFALSGGLDAGFCRQGHPIGLARMRAKVGCNWTALPGIEYCVQDVTRLSLVKPLLIAFDDVLEMPAEARTMEAMCERYAHHLGIEVAAVKDGKDIHMERQANNWPEIVLNLFCHGPIERGLDASAGGVDIVDLALDGIGLATTADSFAAIEQRVVRERRLSWEELKRHLDNDFRDAEQVRLMLASVPRYGAGNTRGDYWAQRVASLWAHLVADTPTPKYHIRCVPGLFSHGGTNRYGERVGATPNGRRAGTPLSHSADPDPGFLPGGAIAVTAKASAVAGAQPGWGNSTPVQIEFDKRLLESMGGIEAVEALIMTHNAMGGTLVNMNVVSKEQVLEAHEDPMTHPDLMIRVTGYSAYFRSLSKEYRQPIVDRILAET